MCPSWWHIYVMWWWRGDWSQIKVHRNFNWNAQGIEPGKGLPLEVLHGHPNPTKHWRSGVTCFPGIQYLLKAGWKSPWGDNLPLINASACLMGLLGFASAKSQDQVQANLCSPFWPGGQENTEACCAYLAPSWAWSAPFHPPAPTLPTSILHSHFPSSIRLFRNLFR